MKLAQLMVRGRGLMLIMAPDGTSVLLNSISKEWALHGPVMKTV